MEKFGAFDRKYLKTVLLSSFSSQMALSFEESKRRIDDCFVRQNDRHDFLRALEDLIRDPAQSLVEKSLYYVSEPWQTEEDARDFLTFIWETVTDEPWPADIPKGNGERFKPKPGHVRGY